MGGARAVGWAGTPAISRASRRVGYARRPGAQAGRLSPSAARIEFRGWNGEPLDAQFRARYSISAVFAVRLPGEELEGRLFFLDKERMTSDDLIVGGIIAHQLAGRLRELFL